MKYGKFDTPQEYIQYVLREWQKFCDWHTPFRKSLVAILQENERLKAENARLKEALKNIRTIIDD